MLRRNVQRSLLVGKVNHKCKSKRNVTGTLTGRGEWSMKNKQKNKISKLDEEIRNLNTVKVGTFDIR